MNQENNGLEMDNDVPPANAEKKRPSKPKTAIGVIVLILLLIFIGWRSLGLFRKNTQNPYVRILSRYYTLISQGLSNDTASLISDDFMDKQGQINRKSHKLTLYLFKIENVTLTNGINASKKVVFCLIDNDTAFSNNAYFLLIKNKPKLSFIDAELSGKKIIEH